MRVARFAQTLVAVIFFFTSTDNCYSSDKIESLVRSFLFADPTKIILPIPIQDDVAMPLTFKSDPISLAENTVHYEIKINKSDISSKMLFDKFKSCESILEIVKKSYGKEFVYYLGKSSDERLLEGSIDVSNWRVSVTCSQNNKVKFAALEMGDKSKIRETLERKRIECEIFDGKRYGGIIYQIDEGGKLLRDEFGHPFRTIEFENDSIVVANEIADSVIKLNRKIGQISIFLKSDPRIKILGSCEKMDAEKKF